MVKQTLESKQQVQPGNRWNIQPGRLDFNRNVKVYVYPDSTVLSSWFANLLDSIRFCLRTIKTSTIIISDTGVQGKRNRMGETWQSTIGLYGNQTCTCICIPRSILSEREKNVHSNRVTLKHNKQTQPETQMRDEKWKWNHYATITLLLQIWIVWNMWHQLQHNGEISDCCQNKDWAVLDTVCEEGGVTSTSPPSHHRWTVRYDLNLGVRPTLPRAPTMPFNDLQKPSLWLPLSSLGENRALRKEEWPGVMFGLPPLVPSHIKPKVMWHELTAATIQELWRTYTFALNMLNYCYMRYIFFVLSIGKTSDVIII